MKKLGILIDTTCTRTARIIESEFIEDIQLSVSVGDHHFDMQNDTVIDLFDHVEKTNLPPKTTLVSIGAFEEKIKGMLTRFEKLIVVPVSSGLSGTMNSAVNAVGLLEDELKNRVMVLNQLSNGPQTTMLVEYILDNMDTAWDSKEKLDNMYKDIDIIIALDTLDYLVLGGRVPATAAKVGSALKLKPILRMKKGEIKPFNAVRSEKAAYKRFVKEAEKIAPLKELKAIGVSFAVGEQAKEIEEKMLALGFGSFTYGEPGDLVNACHLGPKGLALAFMKQ